MVIVRIKGGLGNQMFQYAYAKSLENKGYNVKIDIDVFDIYKPHGGYQLDKYHIKLDCSSKEENGAYYKNNIISRIFKKLGMYNSRIIKEKNHLFNNGFLKIKDDVYIIGYFQTEKYFIDIKNTILKEFSINFNLSNCSCKHKKEIENSNSCSIHVRRQDYINKKNRNIYYHCDLEYYEKSIYFMEKKFNDLKYYVFSDDISWTKKNLKINNSTYVECDKFRYPHEDMHLMSLCKNNIIANSSYSWWGAWLNQNKNKIVIAPKKWFLDKKLREETKDIVCDSWIKI